MFVISISKKLVVKSLRALIMTFMIISIIGMAKGFAGPYNKTVSLAASCTTVALAQGFADELKNTYPDININIKSTDIKNIPTTLQNNHFDIVTTVGLPVHNPSKYINPVAHTIAIKGIIFLVHPSNPIENLTSEQIQNIYNGKYQNWKEVGGQDIPINIIASNNIFGGCEDMIKKNINKLENISYVNSSCEVLQTINTDNNAIGLIPANFSHSRENTKTIKINNIIPSRENIIKGIYPFCQPIFFFTNGYPRPGSLEYRLSRFHLSAKGQKIIEKNEFVALTDY